MARESMAEPLEKPVFGSPDSPELLPHGPIGSSSVEGVWFAVDHHSMVNAAHSDPLDPFALAAGTATTLRAQLRTEQPKELQLEALRSFFREVWKRRSYGSSEFGASRK